MITVAKIGNTTIRKPSKIDSLEKHIARALPPGLSTLAKPLAKLLESGDYSVDQVIGAIVQQHALCGVQVDLKSLQQIGTCIPNQVPYTPEERAQMAQLQDQINAQNARQAVALSRLQQQAMQDFDASLAKNGNGE